MFLMRDRIKANGLREPIVMTIAGILICSFTLLAIAALIHSA